MRTILRDLQSLEGVRCGYVARKDELLASTFAAERKEDLEAAQELARGVAEGLALVERGWEEVLFDFGETCLMVVPIDEGFTLALLAGADTNVDLLRVVMQSSVRQIRAMSALPPLVPTPLATAAPRPAEEPSKSEAPPAAPAEAQKPAGAKPAVVTRLTVAPKPAAPAGGKAAPAAGQQAQKQPGAGAPPKLTVAPKPAAAAKTQPPPEPPPPPKRDKGAEDAEPLLPKILELLTASIGPVARVTFKRGVARWKESNAPTVGNLPVLAEILAADLSSDEEKRFFLGEVERLRGG